MEEYQKHIKDERQSNIKKTNMSFCGEILGAEWAFTGVGHYVANVQCGGRLLACPKCKKVITDLLNENES